MRARLFAVLVAITSTPALAADKPEPKYEGKPLEYWVERFQKAETVGQQVKAVEALMAFGADAAPAVPVLIEMLDDLSPAYRARVLQILASIGPKAKDALPAIANLTASSFSIDAIAAISPTPQEAVPLLVPLLEDKDVARYAFGVLRQLGPAAKEAMPAIRKYAMKKIASELEAKTYSFAELYDLHALGPAVVPLLLEIFEAQGGYARAVSFHCLNQLGAKATKAVPALLTLLKHDNPEMRIRTAAVLWKIDKNPTVITALAGLLNVDPNLTFHSDLDPDRTPLIAESAARMLGEMGADAKAALPELRKAAALGWTFSLFTDESALPFPRAEAGPVHVPRFLSGSATASSERWDVRAIIGLGKAATEAIDKIEKRRKPKQKTTKDLKRY